MGNETTTYNSRAASDCFGLRVGKPHKTEAKAFHFRGRFTGTQILLVNSRILYLELNCILTGIFALIEQPAP
jgi:hypothetical protein